MKTEFAFPQPDARTDGTARQHHRGITVLDYFAGQAMQGLLAGGGDYGKWSELAGDAYKIAASMLEEREKYA